MAFFFLALVQCFVHAAAPAQQAAPDVHQAGAEPQRFIACPVYRDTDSGRKSGCWLATDVQSGLRMDLQQSLTKPQLGHEVLVEGVLPDPEKRQSTDCGGWVLERVRVSVLPQVCPAVVLPAQGYAGRRFEVPATAMTPNHLPQPQPPQPWVTREFHILFDFGHDYLRYQHAEVILQEAVRLAQLGHAQRIRVTGSAAVLPTQVSGRTISEPPALAKQRAHMVELALLRMGWPARQIALRTELRADILPELGAEHAQASLRRVTLRVEIDPRPAPASSHP